MAVIQLNLTGAGHGKSFRAGFMCLNFSHFCETPFQF
jgi:hypothetical protein